MIKHEDLRPGWYWAKDKDEHGLNTEWSVCCVEETQGVLRNGDTLWRCSIISPAKYWRGHAGELIFHSRIEEPND